MFSEHVAELIYQRGKGWPFGPEEAEDVADALIDEYEDLRNIVLSGSIVSPKPIRRAETRLISIWAR